MKLLVDKEIKEEVEKGNLIIEGYKEENVSNTSYDLTVDKIYPATHDDVLTEVSLEPYQVVFVKTKEKLKIPNNYVAFVREKNTVMRAGLVVSAPYYQPGHETYAYLRVLNISSQKIKFSAGATIAQILFFKLDTEPDQPYTGSYQNEETYTGLSTKIK